MLLVRDYVAHMASEVVKRLVEGGQIDHLDPKKMDAVINRVKVRMAEELAVEDKVNDEARQILIDHQDEMRRAGITYQDMFKKVKQQIAKGLGYFLQNVTVEDWPVMRNGKFYGFKIKSVSAEWSVDLRPGDVVTRVNGMPIEICE